MTAPIRLATALPVDTYHNGLLGNVGQFLTAPDEPVLALVVFSAVRVLHDVPTGARVPVLGVREIELACRSVSTATLRELLDTARRERTGVRDLLPFDEALLRGDR